MRWGKGWRERERWTWFHIPCWGEVARETFYREDSWLIAGVPDPIWGLVWPPGNDGFWGLSRKMYSFNPRRPSILSYFLHAPSSIPSEPHLCWAWKRQFSGLFPKPTDPMRWEHDRTGLILRGAILGVVSSCNPSTWEAEVGEARDRLGLIVRPCLRNGGEGQSRSA